MLLIFAVSSRVAAILVTLYKLLESAGLRPALALTLSEPLLELLAGFLESLSRAHK